MTTDTHNPMLDTTYFDVRGADLPDNERETALGITIDYAKTSGHKHSLHEVIINGVRAGLVLLLPNKDRAIVATYKANKSTHYELVFGDFRSTVDGIMSAYLQANK